VLRTYVAAFFALLVFAVPASAHDFKLGDISVTHPWARPTPVGAAVAGGYVKLTNAGAQPDRLIGVTSELAEHVEFHRSAVEDGVASMRPVEAIDIAPGATVDFEVERLHFMFMQPNRQLKNGDRFPATLVFEKSGRIDVEFVVQLRPPAQQPEDHTEHGKPQ
jgi:copper(I)-binding protein